MLGLSLNIIRTLKYTVKHLICYSETSPSNLPCWERVYIFKDKLPHIHVSLNQEFSIISRFNCNFRKGSNQSLWNQIKPYELFNYLN